MPRVEITTNDRGFQAYGKPIRDDHGHLLEVYESSDATGAHVWVSVEASASEPTGTPVASLHLDQEEAEGLRDRLDAFLREAPGRWGEPLSSHRTDLLSATEAFLRAAKHPIPEKPSAPPLRLYSMRLAMLIEEVRELFDASGMHRLEVGDLLGSEASTEDLAAILAGRLVPQRVDLVEAIDAFHDITVVAHGGALEIAGDGTEDTAWEVARSNLDKVVDGEVSRTPNGKITKPEGHVGAQIEKVLLDAGLADRHALLKAEGE